MPTRKKVKDDDGNEYEIELDDDNSKSGGSSSSDDDDDVIELDEDDIEWLKTKRREEQEQQRKASGLSSGKPKAGGKRIVVRPKGSQSADSQSQTPKTNSRIRVLKIRQSA